jgi:hypothetical protein
MAQSVYTAGPRLNFVLARNTIRRIDQNAKNGKADARTGAS